MIRMILYMQDGNVVRFLLNIKITQRNDAVERIAFVILVRLLKLPHLL